MITQLLAPADIESKELQAKRMLAPVGEYAEMTMETSGRDCDGPHFSKSPRLLVTEEEALALLADHFGFQGWTLTEDGRESFFSARMKTDEGYLDRDAWLYWPEAEEA